MMYRICLKNCAFFARHGVYSEEAVLGQRFFVDVELTVDAGSALAQDSIEGTVDYGVAFSVVEDLVTHTRRALIETLALDIAKALIDRFAQISQARITVRKPGAPIPGVLDYVEATIVWPQP